MGWSERKSDGKRNDYGGDKFLKGLRVRAQDRDQALIYHSTLLIDDTSTSTRRRTNPIEDSLSRLGGYINPESSWRGCSYSAKTLKAKLLRPSEDSDESESVKKDADDENEVDSIGESGEGG